METGIAHLLEASIKLECGLEVTINGLVLYHHFMRSVVDYYDEDLVAAVALNLSGRLHEQPIDFDSLLCVFYSIVNQTHDVISCEDVAYQIIKRGLIHVDYVFLRHLEFDLNHFVAHQYLVPFFGMIFERSKNIADFRGELGSTCIRFMNDFYTQPACLAYAPELIAVACIDLGLYVHGLINDLAMVPAWYMGFVCNITPDKVKLLKKIIMRLYEKPFELIPPRQYNVSSRQHPVIQKEQIMPSTEVQHVMPMQVQQVMPVQVQQIMPVQVPQGMPLQVQQGMPLQVQQGMPLQVQQGMPMQVQQGMPMQVQQPVSTQVKQREDIEICL